MNNILESSVNSEFKIQVVQKLESIEEKLNKIVKFKEDIAVEGLKTLENVMIKVYIIPF